MKLKVCGQRDNIGEVAALQPDYLGFIFWEPSSRFFEGDMPQLSQKVKKVGVFVDEKLNELTRLVDKFNLDMIQLHGKESPEYCMEFKNTEVFSLNKPNPELKWKGTDIEIIKVFSIKDDFDFSELEPYEEVCDYYLFDTKGKLPGGNGYRFDWRILKKYPSTKPYFLSGGIGLENIEDIKAFLQTEASKYCHVLDINSKFETEPGLKNIEKIKEFKKLLEHELSR